jgi:hypothetical protein
MSLFRRLRAGCQLIARVTPVNAESEIDRLVRGFSRGDACLPRWEYAAHDLAWMHEALRSLEGTVDKWHDPLRSLFGATLDEIAVELAMAATVGTRALGPLAAERYREPPRDVRSANSLAREWLCASPLERDETLPTDSNDPRSLLSQVRALISAHRAPFAVRVTEGMQALAATGERTVYVAAGRSLTEASARRVATHEVLGHVLPRVRAEGRHPIFAIGTARGTDDQEGLALLYEQREGLQGDRRRGELALRHVAASAMRAGADFVEVFRKLASHSEGTPLDCLVRVATRTFRGSDGTFAGLGRESVYLPALLRVRAHLEKRPDDEEVLASGQVSVASLPKLARLSSGRRRDPAHP